MEIWFWLLIAAAFGGAIGWALHMLYLKRQADAARLADVTAGSILVDGVDPFGGAGPSLACRLYRSGDRVEGEVEGVGKLAFQVV